ncbi:hypothetical protein [Streptomyces tendae]|uniref:hypothetical protein n=1 Tax=Streptomyces tendae TaxID=1932 RepID=UPI003EBE0413
MTETQRSRALSPVETDPGVLVHPTADRRLATEHWLLSTLDGHSRDRARMEWQAGGITLLPLGTLFSAVRLPLRLVLAVAGERSAPSADVDAFLSEALAGGPVICDPSGRRYYALVPATMPTTWHKAVDDWRTADVDCLGRDTYLGVPSTDLDTLNARTYASYWAVPMASAAMLCAPLAIARLIAAGQHQLAQQADAEVGPA